MKFEIEVKRVGDHLLATPEQQSEHAAGFDLCANVDKGIYIPVHGHSLIKTGFAWKIPVGFVGQIWPRSGLAMKHGIDVLAGVIDSDYRGELGVILINHGVANFFIERGDRIAQMLIIPVAHGICVPVLELDSTDRGTGGFGSTGI
jgi:dUTP pyrophosphatase